MAFGKDEPIRWYNFWVCFAVALGTVAFGYPSGVISVTLGKVAFVEYMGLGTAKGLYPDKEGIVGAITSVFQAGAVIGVLLNSWITDKWGRKMGLLVCSVVSVISTVGLTASQNIAMFITFRFFAGASSWGYLATTPGYTSELAQPTYRGFFSGMVGVMLGLGYCSSNFVGLAFYFQNNADASWRAPLGIGLVWPVLILVILPFIPESPRYLLMVDNPDAAWKVVKKLHQDPSDPDDDFARREFYQMHQQATFDRTVESTWIGMFKKPSYRKRVIYGCVFAFITQCSGTLVITNYGPTFYKELGFDTRDSLILQASRDALAFLGNILGSVLIDRFGRRLLILIGLGGCIACLCIEAAMISLYGPAGTNRAGLGVAVCALYTFLLFYAAGLDNAGFVWLSEIFPNFIRAKGLALSIATIALADLVYLQVTPQAFANIGWKYFMVFISTSAAGFIWLYFTMPETNALPLEEIAGLFGDKDEIMVYVKDITLDKETHQLVVQDHEKETGVIVTNEFKGDVAHNEVA